MYYSISRTLELMPWLAGIVLGLTWAFLEIRNFLEQVADGPDIEPGRNGFVRPPGEDGYEFFVTDYTIVYVLRKSARQYRIYLVQGDVPWGVKIKHDRYGSYFKVRSKDSDLVEKIVADTFRKGSRSGAFW